MRTAGHKLIVNFTAAPFFMNPSQTCRPKCVTRTPEEPAHAYHPPVELYDLTADPWEEVNLAGDEAYAAIRSELLASLHEWMIRTGIPWTASPTRPCTAWLWPPCRAARQR